MVNDWITYRKIIETEEATKLVEKLTKEYRRFGEQWEALKWFISRSPEKSSPKRLENGGLCYLMHRDGDSSCDLVEISVVFTYDEQEVTILGVTAWESGDY